MEILNLGSLNIDYVYHVNHFVRPGETLSSDSLNVFCGGKGLNQSIALARAGAHVSHAGKIGKEGTMLINRLRGANVDVSMVEQVEGASGHAIIQVDKSGQNSILLHGGANQEIDKEFACSVIEKFHKGDIVLLQNEISNIPYIMEKAYEKGLQIAFNPSPINSKLLSYPLSYVKWFILNEIEGKEITGKEEPEDIADELLRLYPGCCVVLTLGEKGVYYKDSLKTVSHGVYKVNVVDTTAAGDTFTGYFLAGITQGLAMEDVLKRASIASAISVSRLGASDSIPELAEVTNSDLKLRV